MGDESSEGQEEQEGYVFNACRGGVGFRIRVFSGHLCVNKQHKHGVRHSQPGKGSGLKDKQARNEQMIFLGANHDNQGVTVGGQVDNRFVGPKMWPPTCSHCPKKTTV